MPKRGAILEGTWKLTTLSSTITRLKRFRHVQLGPGLIRLAFLSEHLVQKAKAHPGANQMSGDTKMLILLGRNAQLHGGCQTPCTLPARGIPWHWSHTEMPSHCRRELKRKSSTHNTSSFDERIPVGCLSNRYKARSLTEIVLMLLVMRLIMTCSIRRRFGTTLCVVEESLQVL
jgi:hypothetical protein